MRGATRPCIGRGLAAGLVGGLAGALMLSVTEAAISAIGRGLGGSHRPDRWGGSEDLSQGEPRTKADSGHAATMVAAGAITRATVGIDPSARARHRLGSALHFAVGGATGALYGAVAEMAPAVTMGRGAALGAVVWFLGDEVFVAAAGLAPDPRQSSARAHIQSLAGHLAFGLKVEAVRRWLRSSAV